MDTKYQDNNKNKSVLECEILARQRLLFVTAIVRIVISIVIVCIAAYLFATTSSTDAKIAAGAMLGVIIGYWMR